MAETHASGFKLVVYKEIVEGDFRKFRAESNDAPTGGGARDLRFRPYDVFAPVFEQLFPGKRMEARTRGKTRTQVEILVGHFHWLNDRGGVESMEATFEPPTDARAGEGRIAVVYKYPCFNNLPPTNEGRMLVLLIQHSNGQVWPRFATEDSLRSGDWNEEVARNLLQCLDADRRTGTVARGYFNLSNSAQHWCDG